MNIDMQARKTQALENSELLQAYKMANPEALESYKKDPDAISFLQFERDVIPAITQSVLMSEDPDGFVSKMNLRGIITSYGYDKETADSLIEAGIGSKFSGVDLEHKSYGEAFLGTMKNALYEEIKGTATSVYAFTGNPQLLEFAHGYQRKLEANPILKDYGEIGDLVIGSIQPTMSSLKFVANTALLSWLPGAIGAKTGIKAFQTAAKAGGLLATGLNFTSAGMSQAGTVMYDLYNTTDANGNTLPMDSMASKLLFPVLVFAMGAVELASLSQLPGYRHISRHFTQRELTKALVGGFFAGVKRWGWDSLKSTAAEAVEEGVQYLLGLGFETVLKHVGNKAGSEFKLQTLEETFAQTTKQIYEAGKSMILTSMLSGGLAQGFYSYQMKSMSKQNFAQTKTSQPMDAFFVNTPKAPVQEEAKVTPKGDSTLDKETTGETDKDTTGKDVVDEKLEPIKVVRVGERLVPIDAVEGEKARTANQRKARVVEIELSQDYTFDTDSQTKMAHQAAIATEGKIVDGTTIAYETESDLQYGTFMLAPNIEAVEKTEKGSRVTLRNEDGSLSKLDLVIADDTMETSEPDLTFVENPEAPYALSHMKEDRAYQWHERQIVKDALGDVIQHTGGRISSAGLEASVDAIILTAEALNKPTDELVSKNVVFELVTDLSNEKGDPANAKIEYQKDNQGNKIYKITLNDSANVGSLTHEVGHLLRGLATKEQLQSFVDHYGDGNTAIWLDDITETAGGKFELAGKEYNTFAEAAKQVNKYEERFASDFVTYLRTGKAPTTALQNIFSRMKAVLKSLVGAYGYELDPAVKRAFDQLFAESEVGVSQETQGEVGNEVGNLDEKSVIEGSDLFEMDQEQYDKVLSDYKGTDKWLLSPNGSPTNLTEKQWVQVRTPNFIKMFGDWLNDPGSIHPDALDLNGEPEVFYHGSSSNTIEEFELQPSLGYYNENNRGGFSFTNDKRAAEAYAQPEAVRVRSIQKYLTEVEEALDDAGIVDAMSLEEGEKLDATSQKFYDLLKEDDDVGYFGEEQTLPDFRYVYWDNEDSPFSKGRDEWSKIIPRLIQKDFPVLAKRLRSANKDVKLKGVTTPKVYEVFLNIPKGTRTQDLTRSTLYKVGDYFDVRQEDTKAFVVRLGNNEKVVYIADSSMIKSATDNSGSFSSSPNILYEEALTIDWDMLPFDADMKTLETKEQIAAHNTVVEIANLLIEDDRLTYDMLSDLSKLEKLLIDGDENSLLDKMEDRFNAVNSDIYLMDLYEEHLEYDEGKINEVWGVIDVFELAVQERGLTDDIYEAGYILPDGRLLDFSDKRDGGPAGTRSADHRSLALAVNEDLSGTDLMVAFQQMGAIRIDANSGLIDLETRPTYAQNSVIKDLIIMNEEAYVDLQDGVRRASFQSGGDPDRAISLIARFYNGQDINKGTVLFEMAPPVDSEDFEAKFGNTKVADSYGNPILVSHGSPYQFDDFKKTQVSDAGYLGAGYYFSGLSGVAEQYATKSENGFIYKAYLNMEHPFLWQEEWNKQWNVITGSIEQEHPTVHRGSDEFGRLITSTLKEMGYDGVLDMKNGIVNEAVVFNNNQIGIVTVEGFNISDMSKLYQPNFGSDGVLYEAVENKKPLEDRVSGDKLDEIYEAMEDIRDVGGYVDEYGYVTVYHRTSRVAADEIARTGIMVAKEDGLFFSTEREGQAVGYGDSIVKLEIPLEQLEMDDMFDNEIHFRLPLKRVLRKNVSPFNPTVLFEQAAPVESEAFKAWFGESKVVDDNGNPLVVYHGTIQSFNVFRMGDIGFHFGDIEQAETRVEGETNPNIMGVYLSIENPYISSYDYGSWDGDYVARGFIERGEFTDDADVAILKNIAKHQAPRSSTELRKFLRDKGYDGVVYPNGFESEGDNDSYIAFSPIQIKSIDNQGTWDNTNPNILFEKAAPLGSEAFKAGFGDSKVVDENGNPLVVYHSTNTEFEVFDTSDKSLDFTIPNNRGDNIGAFFTTSARNSKYFGNNTMAVYLSIQNPKVFDTQDNFREFIRSNFKMEEETLTESAKFSNDTRRILEEQGYDGVIIKKAQFGGKTSKESWYVAFSPTQIKSVNNQGTWDNTNPNILFEKATPLGSKAFKAWFKDSEVVDDNGDPLVMYHGTKSDFTTFEAKYGDGLNFFSTNPEFASKWGFNLDPLPEAEYLFDEARAYENQLAKEYGIEALDNLEGEEWSKRYEEIKAKIAPKIEERYGVEISTRADRAYGTSVMPVYLSVQNAFNPATDYEILLPYMPEILTGWTGDKQMLNYMKNGNWLIYENEKTIAKLKELGYDGVWLRESTDGDVETLAVFENTQVKSVFNSGAWDIGNPNVLYEQLPKLSTGDLDDLGVDKFALLLADRTAAGYDFTGMDGATVTPYFLQGGPGYATLDENLAHDIVWAVQGKGKTTVLKDRAAETDGYVLVLMMAPYAHRSNITVVDNYIKIFEKYVEEGDRIKPKDLEKIYNIVKKAEALKDMPYFGDVEAFYDWFYNKSTFDVRAELMNRFGLESVQKLGMPPLEKYLKLLEEKNYNIPSMNLGDGLLLLKIDTSENFLVELGTEGTPIHPSYKYGIKGKPVGILAKPLGRQLILEEYSKQRREGSDGTVTAQDWRATEWASPVVQITDRIREVLQGEGYQYIKGGRHANIIVDFLADNWITSDQATGEGGISNASFIKALKNNRGSESLTIPTEKVLNQRTKAGLERIYKLSEWVKDDTGKNVEIYFSLKFDKPWYSEQAGLGENEVVLQSVMTNELGMGQILPMIMAKAISEGATVLDAFALKTDDYPKGMLPTVYGRYGFETVFTMPWDQGEYDKTHTASQFRDLIAYWETLGWSEERHGMPDLVVMKINEETIGGREGYLQRFISQDGEGFWHGDVERGIDESVRNHNDGRGTGEVSRAGERDGATLGRDQGYNGWDSGRKALANQSLEVLSLEKIDRENLGIDEQAYNKAIERHGYRTMPEESSATTLYELSDEAKQHVLESRKKDVQTAIEQFYWISDEILKEYIGEEWADNELRFREHLKEFPWALEEARKFADTEEFLEHLKTSTEVADYQWALEDEQWFKRIHAYSRIMSPEQRDAQFIRLHTASHDKLLALGNRLKGYEDVASVPRAKSRKGPRKFVTYKWGAFKGVSTHVKRLTKNSTDVEFERAAELIQKNPRPYRQAIQVIEQAEARVLEMKGLSHRTDASREAYYDSLGEDMQEMLKEPLALNEMTNREAAEYLRSSDDPKERYDARDRLATHEGVLALEQQANKELKELGAAKDIDIKKVTKQLSKALDQVETINEDFKQAKNELRKTLTSLKNERKRVAELSGKLREKTAQASQVNQLTKDLADRRARVKELRSLLTEQNENVRKLTKTKESLQRRLEAKRTRQTLEKLHGRILKAVNYNSDSIDASFESVFNAIKNIFDQKQKADGTVIQLPKEMSQYLSQNHLEWILKGKKIGQWSVESLEVLLEAAKLMRMDARAMLDQKKLKRTTDLQNLALEMYRQTYGQTPEISPGYGSIMNDIISDLMTKQNQYEENVFNAMLDTVKASIGKVQRIARVLDGHKEGVMYDLLVRRAYSHMTEEIRETYRRLEEADAKMKELGINDEHLLKHTFKFTPKSGQERTLTKGEVIGIYVYSQNPLGKNKLVHDRGNQLSPMDIARAIGSLTENEKAWGDYMIDSLGGDEVWERQRDVFYEVYNQNLGRRDRYFTFVSEGKLLDEGKTDILAGPKGQKLRYTDKDFTKVVNPNAVYPLRLDVTGTFRSQVKKQEHFIQWAAWTRDMNYLLSKGAIGKIIEMQNGPKYLAAVESYVREVGSPQSLMDDIERLGSKLVSNAAVAALSLNFLTMLKQLPSFTAALRGDVGALELLQVSMRLTNPLTYGEAIAFIHEMSPYMKKRAITVEIERYNATDFNTYAGRKIGEFNEKIGMKGIYFMDQAAVNTLWLAAYDTYLRRNPMGLEGDALKQEAAFKATQLISETQPTSIITDLSSIQTKKSPWVRSALLFTNQMFQYVNMVWYDLPTSVKAFKATKDPAHIRKIFGIVTNMAMSGALIMLISGVAFRKDDEDDKAYWKRIGKEVAQTVASYSIPIVGNMVSQGASGYSSGSIVDLPSAFGRLLGTDWTNAEKVSDRIWDLLDAGASVTALPTAFINRLIKSIDRKNPLEMFGANYGELWESR